jgi:hypothetical protein
MTKNSSNKGQQQPKNNNNKNNTKKKVNNDVVSVDWITSLAKQSTESSNNNNIKILSKEDRKRKREAKQERRRIQQQQQQQQQQQHQYATINNNNNKDRKGAAAATRLHDISKRRIYRISKQIQDLRKEAYHNMKKNIEDDDIENDRPVIRPYNAKTAAKTIATSNKKRSHRGTNKWSEESIQPRPSDYSGIGLARQSLYIEFIDPAYYPKVEEEFREHIPGFFGKQRTKAMKKQTDGNMLWRQLVHNKHGMSKKLKSMNPDERVQAMIDSGMI